MPLVLFNPSIGPYQVLPCRARVDLGAKAMKGYSAFPKAPALLEPHHQIVSVITRTHSGGSAVVSILLYGCTNWTLTKRLEKKLDGNYTRMLRAILNKSWQQHPTMHQLYGHLPPITKTIQARRTRHAGHCWRSKDVFTSDVLLWTSTYGQAKAGRPARTCIQQLCEDTGCSPEDLPEAMNDREKWWERVRDIRAGSTTSWWWPLCRGAVSVFYSPNRLGNILLSVTLADCHKHFMFGEHI